MEFITNLWRQNYFTEGDKYHYYHARSGNFYSIPKQVQNRFNILYYRAFICFVALVVLVAMDFMNPLFIGFCAIILYVALTFTFYNKLLPELSFQTKYDIENYRIKNTRKTEKTNPLRTGLIIVFALLLIIYTYLSKYDVFISISCYVIAIIALFTAIKDLIRR